MKVRAIKKGYYGLLLREPGMPGDVFDIKDEADFSAKWMERVTAKDRKESGEEEPGRKGQPKRDKSVI